MFSNRLAFALLTVGCLGAAAAGGYFATRQNVVPAATQAATTSAEAPAPTSDRTLVQESATQTSERASESPAAPLVRNGTAAASPRAESSSHAALQTPSASRLPRPTAAPKRDQAVPAPERPSSNVTAALPVPVPNSNGAASTASIETNTPPSRADDRGQDAPRIAETPQKTFDELVVVADSVIGLQAETTVTSERARVEDRVEARVTRDVRVHDIVAIPSGSRAFGTVVSVERGGKFKERARLGIRFHTLMLADGTRLPISTDTIYREGEPPGKETAAKMSGAAVGGAILGAILGGGKGAAIGGAVGAGAGASAAMAAERSQATLHAGEPITVRILAPITVTLDQK